MSRVLVPGLKILPRTEIRKRRELPLEGSVVVEVGQNVTSDQVVAEANVPGELFILRLPERMGIESFEVIEGMKVKEGDEVQKGDLLCEHSGLFGLLHTRFQAPESGTIEFIARKTGHVGLRLPAKPITVQAYMAGVIEEVDAGKGCVIVNKGTFIQGIFGVGRECTGHLHVLPVENNHEVQPSDIPDDVRGALLAGGARYTLEALRVAEERGAKGIITGSIDDSVLAGYLGYELGIALTGDEDVAMTLIITEGFGFLALSDHIRTLLDAHNGKEASINGATQVRAGAIRPEIIITSTEGLEHLSDTSDEEQGLRVGGEVRIIRVPYFGKRATITELPHEEEQIDTGAHTRVLRAKLSCTEEIVTVPRANVELF